MTELILIEIAAVSAERSRGRHNPWSSSAR
jgi:hypothetical protein